MLNFVRILSHMKLEFKDWAKKIPKKISSFIPWSN